MTAEIVQVPGWAQFGWLRHGFSTRRGGVSHVYAPGDLNLGFTPDDDPESVRENRRRLVAAVAGPGSTPPLATVRQVHGTLVLRAEKTGEPPSEADGLFTASPGLMLGIQVADCVPILVADTRLRVVAAIHAGWRGTAAGIIGAGIQQMRQQFSSQPQDLVAAIGPSIRSCCYTVGDQVRSEFERQFPYAAELFEPHDGSITLDLAKANRRQMLDAGMAEGAVTVLADCTGCATLEGRRKYFSHRLEHGFTGRAMGMIGIAG